MQEIGFDIISDLNLDPNDSFNWENKATSLYCIVAGNISSNLRTVIQVLLHLSTKYQGVFFVPGRLEYETSDNFAKRTEELSSIAQGIPNLVMLYQNVIVVDGIAILGSNGWGNIETTLDFRNTAVPNEDLYFGEKPDNTVDQMPLYNILTADTEKKVSHWVFGTYNKPVDTTIDEINYLSNPYHRYGPYWAKRLTVLI